jgi:phosphohistidine phosphatase
MRRLMLLRHAKSDWSKPGQPDHERELNARGRKAAPRMGAYIAEQGFLPDLIVSSTAVRTRQTLELARAAFGGKPKVSFEGRIYEADTDDILEVLKETKANVHTLLVVGHNPGLSDLAELLISFGDSSANQQLLEKFPTAALAVIDFAIDDWRDLRPHSGRLDRFVTPRALGPADED